MLNASRIEFETKVLDVKFLQERIFVASNNHTRNNNHCCLQCPSWNKASRQNQSTWHYILRTLERHITEIAFENIFCFFYDFLKKH